MRLKDNVLIRMPNEAFKLNPTGARVIDHILSGGSVKDIIRARPDPMKLKTVGSYRIFTYGTEIAETIINLLS